MTDLFKAIEDAYDGKPSLFDAVTKDDLIIAFFPCIYFSALSQMQMSLTEVNKRNMPIEARYEAVIERSRNRQRFLELLIMLMGTCEIRGLRLIVENPWDMQTYLKTGFIKQPSLIDNDRTKRGDYFQKPTAFWFINCEPTHGSTFQPTPEERKMRIPMHKEQDDKYGRERLATHKAKTGICDEGRSMITEDYARYFIADFILGKPSGTVPQQTDLFDALDGRADG